MKKLLMMSMLLIIAAFSSTAQTASTTASIKLVEQNQPAKTYSAAIGKAKLSVQTYRNNKGVEYEVFESVNGKYFIIKQSKTGNYYKVYLKEDVSIKTQQP